MSRIQFNHFANSIIPINEAPVESPAMKKAFNEFAENKVQLKELEKLVNQLKTRNSEIALIIEPVLKKLADEIGETDKYIVKLKRPSTTRTNTSWSDAFVLALSKVNAPTKAVLNQAVAESQNVTKVSATIDVFLKEGIMDSIKLFIAKVKKKWAGISKKIQQISSLNAALGNVVVKMI